MSKQDKQEPSAFSDANPFLALNKKAFPDHKRKGAAPVPKTPARPAPEPDADAHLFLRSVDGVAPLGASRKTQAKEDETAWAHMADLVDLPKHAAKKHKTPPGGQCAASAPVKTVQTPKPADADDFGSFASAMRDVKPLSGKGRELPAPVETPAQAAIPADQTMYDVLKDKLEFATHYTDEYVEGHVVGLDLITVGKLQAGQFSPEAHLDLHGLNALQAYQRLVGFMRNAYMRNQRTVLLVPGRGLNSPNGMAVLRDKVQTWLTQEPFRRVVLAFCTAQPSDGGAGALYVLLRKFRKDQGKVQWDRVPVDPDLLMD